MLEHAQRPGIHCPGDSSNEKLGAADTKIKDTYKALTLKKFIYWNVLFEDRGFRVSSVPERMF